MTSKPNYPEAVERVPLTAQMARAHADMYADLKAENDALKALVQRTTESAEAQVAALLNAKEAAEGEVERLLARLDKLETENERLRIVEVFADERDPLVDATHFRDRAEAAEAKLSTLEKALGKIDAHAENGLFYVDVKGKNERFSSIRELIRQALSNLPKSGGVLEVAAADNNRGAE